jgi:hypothetical protein
MAAAITIYCKRSLAGSIPEQIRACVDAADWWTLAEGYGIDDEAVVNAALDHFRIEPQATDLGEAYRVHYRPEGQRQIDVWRWTDAEEVAEELAGAREELTRARRAGARGLREHLAGAKEVVRIDLRWGQLKGMAVVLAYEITRWLAHGARGCIRDHEGQWWVLTRRGAYKLILSPRA